MLFRSQAGPFSLEQLVQKAITPETLVWAQGMKDWTPAWKIAELKDVYKRQIQRSPFTQEGCQVDNLLGHHLSILCLITDKSNTFSKWDPNNREKYIGEPDVWNETEEDIRQMLEELNIPFTEDVGEAAFYGDVYKRQV